MKKDKMVLLKDFSSNDFFKTLPWLTQALVTFLFIVYFIQITFLFIFGSTWFRSSFALTTEGVAHGKIWEFLTYAFLHDELEPLHLLTNAIAIYFLGNQLEKVLGHFRLALLFIGGAIAGGMGWYFFGGPIHEPGLIGASGVVFSFLLAFAFCLQEIWVRSLTFHYDIQSNRFIFNPTFFLSIQVVVLIFVIFEAICLVFDIPTGSSHTAHLAGAIFGYLYVRLWPIKPLAHTKSSS
ncbi:rhomboid family intramembrane serine protease [Candidatus Methylacidiphilum fumarolicum]|uniref:Membrane associated serine protease n=2 Tax=Candidatus Methylacidiphilum fumarolicum TaxID=591154 RepID=I0K166_METFB|nr:rhomboid family intramembrane serine protease [Candidatus Methylacidiphilum fumarolicum]MBW6415008.1 rhomboid family intramembrane serine protease [Candidatus Methylacidiphilum fumarolicum]TFE70394.1 rhomboid family intramembrane serine protease [Candidatus Methylacidiphilum fumarolicum]TFE74019.1 rhomboid family intramembrane serine protease [Candidatus Methylacidiphilum fumarolicum]TFE74527.1 rhomboid family intramembrane serine protease [Candidatus Methylacidiphilum fumarolicum]TFE77907.